MPTEFGRERRVASQMTRILNELLRSDVKDPRLEHVSVSAVELSGDLGVARVYFSLLRPDDDPDPVASAFESAGGFLRSRVAKALGLRRVPEMRFMHDESYKRGLEMTHLLDEMSPDDHT